MKLLITLMLLLVTSIAQGKQTLVVMSPHHTPETAKAQFTQIVSLYTELPLGDTLTVIDGEHANTVATLSVPTKDIYRHPKARIQAARNALASLKVFASKADKGHRTQGAMDIPHVLYTLARHYPSAKDIVFLGISPLHDVSGQIGFTMRLGHYPSDAFFQYAATDNPFGVVGRESLLVGKRIHWYLPEDKHNEGVFKQSVARFWHLYLDLQGGKLISYTQDNQAVFRLLLDEATPLPMPYTLRKGDKREMIQSPRYYLDMSTPKTSSIFDTHQPVKVSVQWHNRDVDLDLYTHVDDGEVVFFENVQSAGAQHAKAKGANDDSHLETIQYRQPVDLEKLKMVVNVYAMRKAVKSLSGMVWVYVGEKTFMMPFTFTVTHGNKGSDAKSVINSGKSSPFSLYFTLETILKHAKEKANA